MIKGYYSPWAAQLLRICDELRAMQADKLTECRLLLAFNYNEEIAKTVEANLKACSIWNERHTKLSSLLLDL